MKILYLVEFDDTPRFWYPRVALAVLINFVFSPDENLLSNFRKSEKETKRRKIKNKISLPCSSHALGPFLPFLLTYAFYFFYFFILFYFIIIIIIILFFLFLDSFISFYYIINHVANCESHIQVHHMACHVSPNIQCLEKREIPTISESDKIRWVN